ncbi:STAS domain-containing protein [Curtobacterium sp. VKM Ac-1393]|uniref:STAS domain-containing protein n=1 Tax=Curtobacterium sp. VKM Ac-1393 TaxID=2783814 RepID=UPI00188CFC4E|nr:STAS domain-containing protein [Curtobacterium sp. VKM Ac-1393]MBF4606804.1 STAS domain-containing protein [Curtobacterium sp. VKM Ac-1393]
MDIVVHEAQPDTAVLECSGRLNMVSAPAFREAVAQVVADGRARVVVELSGVEFMDSSGLGALVGSLKTARQAGGDLRIAAPSEQVQMVLQLSNIDKILRTYPDGDSAVTDW